MSTLNAYLSFDGDCREAMEFYQGCLGGKLTVQKIGDSPLAEKMPAKMKDQVLHASLTHKNFELMGTDCAPGEGLLKGNAVSLCMNCVSEEEVNRLYDTLSRGGKKKFPLEVTFWGALFGGVTDKYGHHWLLNYQITTLN
jgi:PhnB protein